ncbi:MAG: hypothetical protein N4R38_06045 [Lactobacillus crispatus]|nr:hypothetical protein [Lactobacillus crispatus]MCT7862056.1 hypothetical protein [Lactobacillus crispatus]
MSKKQIEELKEEADATHATEMKTVIMLICVAAYWVMVIAAIFMNPKLDIVLFKGNQTYKQLLEIMLYGGAVMPIGFAINLGVICSSQYTQMKLLIKELESNQVKTLQNTSQTK